MSAYCLVKLKTNAVMSGEKGKNPMCWQQYLAATAMIWQCLSTPSVDCSSYLQRDDIAETAAQPSSKMAGLLQLMQ